MNTIEMILIRFGLLCYSIINITPAIYFVQLLSESFKLYIYLELTSKSASYLIIYYNTEN